MRRHELRRHISTNRETLPGDLRKLGEQYDGIIQWDQSNRAYIMTHGVSGIDWKHYKHPLPDTCMITVRNSGKK